MLDDIYFMKQALIEAGKAAERGEVPVGAVVVCKERIIARAHNLTETLNGMEAIILSMTPYERENPNVLNSSRKRRIAAGSGTQVVDINRLLKQFEMMQAMTKQFAGGKMPKSMRRLMGKKGGKGMLGGKMPGLPF